MYLKPHANTPEGRDFLECELRSRGIHVHDHGEISAEQLKTEGIIDAHYGDLAAKAMRARPSDLPVTPAAREAFQDAFGLAWGEALDRGLVCNAAEAMERLGLSGEELEAVWAPLRFGQGKVKLASGCYCGRLRGIYVINGFYLGMRATYTRPNSSVHWYKVSFSASETRWAHFRQEVVGHTDPTLAMPNSLRSLFLRKWRELGLLEEPHSGENSLHASASPLEALAERRNWLRVPLLEDPFYRQLAERGVQQRHVQHWLGNPSLSSGDGRTASAFDHFEDHDTEKCLVLAEQLAARQG